MGQYNVGDESVSSEVLNHSNHGSKNSLEEKEIGTGSPSVNEVRPGVLV